MATLKVRLANLDMAAAKHNVKVSVWPRGLSSVSALLGSALTRPAHANGVNADVILQRLGKNTLKISKELQVEFKEVFKVNPSDTNLAAVLAFRVPNKITQTLPRKNSKAIEVYAKACVELKFESHRKGSLNKETKQIEDPAVYVDKYVKKITAQSKRKAPRTAKPRNTKTG